MRLDRLPTCANHSGLGWHDPGLLREFGWLVAGDRRLAHELQVGRDLARLEHAGLARPGRAARSRGRQGRRAIPDLRARHRGLLRHVLDPSVDESTTVAVVTPQ